VKKLPRAPRSGVASPEAQALDELPNKEDTNKGERKDEEQEAETEQQEEGRNASQLALGRRMGIADIDPYQLLRLSESVGGFSEEEVNHTHHHQQQQRCHQAAVDLKSSPSVAKRKERTLNRLAWGKFHKV
jgi:hypothetical protein